jgi:hypothetical protein
VLAPGWPQAYQSLEDGAYRFWVQATDAAGSVDLTPATYSWSVHLSQYANISTSPPPATANTTATFEFEELGDGLAAGGGGAAFQCALQQQGAGSGVTATAPSAALASCGSPKVGAAKPCARMHRAPHELVVHTDGTEGHGSVGWRVGNTMTTSLASPGPTSRKPVGYTWSYVACRIGYLDPIDHQ